MLEEFIDIAESRHDLNAVQMEQAIVWMLAGRVEDDQIGRPVSYTHLTLPTKA